MDFKKVIKDNLKKDYKEIRKLSSLPYGYLLVEVRAGTGNCRFGFSFETQSETLMIVKPKLFSFTKEVEPLLGFFPGKKNLLVSVRILTPMTDYSYVYRRYEIKRKMNGEFSVKKQTVSTKNFRKDGEK